MIAPVLVAGVALAATSSLAVELENPASWRKHRLGSVWIVTDAGPNEAEAIGHQLAAFQALLRDTTSGLLFDAVGTTQLVAFRDARRLRGYDGREGWMPALGLYLPTRVGGCEAIIATAANAEQALRWGRLRRSYPRPHAAALHEYVHHVLTASFPTLPSWVDEGLATYFETFVASGNEAEIGFPPQHIFEAALTMEPLPMEALFSLPDRPARDRPEWEAQYVQSWALFHYFLRGRPSRTEQLERFLSLLKRGAPQRDAWHEAFGAAADSLPKEALRHVRRGRFRVRRYDITALPVPALGEARPLGPGELYGLLAKLKLRVGEDRVGAEARAGAALSADPWEPRALAAMTEIRALQGRRDEAVAFGEKALRAAVGDRSLELEATILLKALGEADRARDVLDETAPPAPPHP